MAVGSVLSHGAPDSPVRHRTLSGAPATSADRWGSTVEALSCGPAWLSGGAPDKSCRLSGAPSRACLTSTRTVAHWMRLQTTVAREVAVAPLAHRTVWCGTGHCPVNYSGAPSDFPEGEEFSLECPGAPDTVRWCTGNNWTVRCARPRCLWVVFCSPCLNPFLVFLLAYCEPLAPVKTYRLEQTSSSNYLCWAIQPPKSITK
jgi:hypothetical protein